MSDSSNTKNGSGTPGMHNFQPSIKVTFANQQISLNNKFIESVSAKIKQLKEEANNEQDEQKKVTLVNKYQNIETMLKSSLMEYKQKLQQQQQQQPSVPASSGNTSTANANSNAFNSSKSATNVGNPSSNNNISIKNYLTDEQKAQYANINKQFQQKIQQIVSTYDNNKKEMEKILEKIKLTNPDTMKKEMEDLLAMKAKCETNGKTLQGAYKNLEVQMSDLKKRFYLKCSETNADLKKALLIAQMSQQQKQQSTPQQVSQPTAVQPQVSNPAAQTKSNNSAPLPQTTAAQVAAQKKQKPLSSSVNPSPLKQTTGNSILKPAIHENSLLTDVSSNIAPVTIKTSQYKKDATQPTVSGGYLGSNPILSQPLNRVLPQPVSTTPLPAPNAAATGKKNAYIPTPQDHILTKRKLRDLLKQYNGNSANIDGDVEELLLDLSDNFIEQVVKFGGKVAKLRKCENLEVKDVKFALEKGFGLEL